MLEFIGEQFRNGGMGMYPILAFGFALTAGSALYALRPERRLLPLLLNLGFTTLVSGVLGFSMGLMLTFRYIQKVDAPRQFTVSALGFSESITNLILALMLLTVSGLLVSIGAFRALRSGRAL